MSLAKEATLPLIGEEFYNSVAALANAHREGSSVDLSLNGLPDLEVTIAFDTNKKGACSGDRTNIGSIQARVVVPRKDQTGDWARKNKEWIVRFLDEVEKGYGKLDAHTVSHYSLTQAIYAPTDIFGVHTYSRPIVMELKYNSYHTQINWGRIRPLLKSPQLDVRGTTFFDLPGLQTSVDESFARGGGVVIWRDHMVPVKDVLKACIDVLEGESRVFEQLYPTLVLETMDDTIFSYAMKEDLYRVGEEESIIALRSRLMLQRGAITDSKKYVLPAHVALAGEWIRALSGRESLRATIEVGTSYSTMKNRVEVRR